MNTTLQPIFARHQGQAGSLLPILHDIQHALGYVPEEAVPLIAKELNLSRAEVHGVISYYHHFCRTPPGKHVVQVCCAEACQANGSEALAAHAAKRSLHGDVTVEPVYCLGLCSVGPNIQIDEDELHAQVTTKKFDELMNNINQLNPNPLQLPLVRGRAESAPPLTRGGWEGLEPNAQSGMNEPGDAK